jgi:hypothetical protein
VYVVLYIPSPDLFLPPHFPILAANTVPPTDMAKHKAADAPKEQILEIKVHWSAVGRDRKVWPEYTVLTEENLGAILEVLGRGEVKDALEVKVGKGE